MPFKDPQAKAEYMRRYRADKLDKLKQRQADWYAENAKRVRAKRNEAYRVQRASTTAEQIHEVVQLVKTSSK